MHNKHNLKVKGMEASVLISENFPDSALPLPSLVMLTLTIQKT